MLTPRDVDNRKPLEYESFMDYIFGKFIGNKGYASKDLFNKLFVNGIQLISKLKGNIKGAVFFVIAKGKSHCRVR